MQRYINILPYRDTLAVILYRYTFEPYRYIEYRDISMYRHQNVCLYTYN